MDPCEEGTNSFSCCQLLNALPTFGITSKIDKRSDSLKEMSLLLQLCMLLALTAVLAYDVKFFEAPPADKDPGIYYYDMVLHTERQENIKAVLTKVNKPVGFVHTMPATAENGCTVHLPTSEIAESYGCKFAINGGPFDMSEGGGCVGSLISDGVILQVNDTGGFASWGMTKDGRYVFGTQINSSIVEAEGVVELISGFIGPLLVEDGKAVHSDAKLIAQRTAIGIDAQGALLFLTIDGAEGRDRGMNISELADAFVELGAVQALNLDGGGSTTAWMDGKGYIDRPTCNDYLVPECERDVADIICVTAGVE